MSDQKRQQFLASDKLISIAEAASLTPYSPEYLGLLARTGRLKAVKIARNWLTSREAVLEYVRTQQDRYAKSIERLKQIERGLS
jgi:hypothetical protein